MASVADALAPVLATTPVHPYQYDFSAALLAKDVSS